jgi:hypothetical protein
MAFATRIAIRTDPNFDHKRTNTMCLSLFTVGYQRKSP